MNVSYLLENSAAKYPDMTAVAAGSDRCTYQALNDRSKRLAGAMLGRGLVKGDRVAIVAANSVFFVETYFAAIRAGLVAALVNTRLAPPELIYIINNSESKALFYGPEFEDTVNMIRGDLKTVRMYVSPREGGSAFAVEFESFFQPGGIGALPESTAEDEPCQIVYTSGTTGRPKGAVLTHGNILWNFFNTVMAREDRHGQTSIIIGPLFHVAPLNNQLTIQLGMGGTSVLMRKFDPEEVLRTIQEEKVSLIVTPPAVYNLLMQHPEASRYDTGSVIRVSSGADKLLMETKRKIFDFFPNVKGVINAYGCTETTATVTVLKEGDSHRKGDSVGRPVPFLQVRVVDDEDRPLPPGEVGELVCKGPVVMRGYFNNPEATREAIRDGWLHTGDMARMDEEGYFYIVDRKKDMLVSGGENIYPREVEEVLYTHPEISDAAVVGVPDETWGESVKAFVVRKPGSAISAEDVIEYCKSRLAGYKKPKTVTFLDVIPRSASGKALKNRLRGVKQADDILMKERKS